jgi:hypothetical protein
MKNKIFSIILSIALSLPVAVWAVDDVIVDDLDTRPAVSQLDEDIVEEELPSDYKQPISKRKIANKFLKAMAGVAASSFIIFFMLTVYNRFRDRFFEQVKTPEGETTLETPDNLNDAVKIFLDKTRW